MYNQLKLLLTGLIVLLFAVSIPSISTAFAYSGRAQVSTAPATAPLVRPTGENCTDCFAGYADGGSSGSVSSISTGLTVPTVSCSKKSSPEYSAWGVWVDGSGPDDFAGASITAACSSGKVNYYAAWFDANINTTCTLCQQNATWTPAAGNKVYLSVSYNSKTSKFNFVLNDITKGKDYSKSNALKDVSLDFGVCSSDMFLNSSSDVQPSVKFSAVPFTKCLVDGKPVGSGPNGTTVIEFFCVNSAGDAYLAKPTALKAQENFDVKFVATGP